MADLASITLSLTPKSSTDFLGQRNDFDRVALKLLEGKPLTEAEKDLLKSFSNNGEKLTEQDIKHLQAYMKMTGEVDDTDSDEIDLELDPTKSVSANRLEAKQKHFAKELKAFQDKMLTIFGDNFKTTPLYKSLTKMIKAINDSTNADSFQRSIRTELADRSNNNPAIDSLSPTELNLLAKGALENVTIRELLPEDDTAAAGTPSGNSGLSVELGLDSSAKEWLENLEAVKTSVEPFDQYKAEYLTRKMKKLEELDPDEDFDAMRHFLYLKNNKVTDAEVERHIEAFNNQVRKAKELNPGDDLSDLDSDMRLNLLAQKAQLPTDIPSEKESALVAASSYLHGSSRYRSNNPNLKTLEDLYNKANSGQALPRDLKERKQFLKTYLDRIFKKAQETEAASDEGHYSVANPERVFEEFKENLLFLGDYVFTNSKNDAERKALQDDLIRFARGEEASPELIKAFGSDADKLEALNYLKRGSGDPRRTVGFLKALFTMPYKKNGVVQDSLNFYGLVEESNSFEELAAKLRDACGGGKFGEGDLRIPEELLLGSEEKDIYRLGDLSIFESGFDVQQGQDGKEIRVPNGKFEIFKLLGFNPSSARFDTSDDAEDTLAEQLRKTDSGEDSKIYQLMSIIFDGDDDKISEAIRIALEGVDENDEDDSSTDSGSDSISLQGNGELLANFLMKAIKDQESSFIEYGDDSEQKLEDIISKRRKLFEFSEKNNLGIYAKDEMLSIYHENEYEQFLKDFAMSIKHMEPMLKAEKAFYRVPPELKVDYSYGTTETEVILADDEVEVLTDDSQQLMNAQDQEILLSWLNDFFNSGSGYSFPSIFSGDSGFGLFGTGQGSYLNPMGLSGMGTDYSNPYSFFA